MNYISKIFKKIIYSTTSLRKVCSSKPWSTKKNKIKLHKSNQPKIIFHLN